MTMLVIACLVPVATLLAMAAARCPRTWDEWKPRVGTVLLLFLVGVYAAEPFLRGTFVGTGEAYNYDLSVADAVTQARSGVFPVLVGQTEFAFNGRIHPLRTAPWYCCAACILDFATFHSLNFWQLQDAILTLSIVATLFSTYASLRLLVGTSRTVGLLGAVIFGLSPGVLSTVYAMDLFMTVTALPLVPIVAASNIASFSRRSLPIYLVLGAAIGFAWLAHPPIALWLSTSTAVFQLVNWTTRKPTWRAVGAGISGLLVCLLLASYSFASTEEMHFIGGLSRAEDFSPLFVELSKAFPSCLRPISDEARSLSDFQLGYVAWALLLAGAAISAHRRHLASLVSFACAAFLILLTLPVPYLTKAIWLHLPPLFPQLTNIWPMQRLYLVATGLIITGCSVLWREGDPQVRAGPSWRRLFVMAICAGSLFWEIEQARFFIKRGDVLQHKSEESADLLRSENIDLTLTSYALLDIPSRFVNGVMDAGREFRILREADRLEIANNWTPSNPGRLRAHGALHTVTMQLNPAHLAPLIRIEPDRRYRLWLKFRSAPFNGVFIMRGRHFSRDYPLPSAGQSRGFGMKPGNDPSIVLWTTDPDGTDIEIMLVGEPQGGIFADFELREIDPASFPVDLEGLVPLSGRVRVRDPSWLETPRRFIPGYEASIDGAPAQVAISPEEAVMIKVPSGEHEFRLRYTGSPWLLGAFWTSFSTGCVLVLGTAAWMAFRGVQHVRARMQSGRGVAASTAGSRHGQA
jgi:hypothetical protein